MADLDQGWRDAAVLPDGVHDLLDRAPSVGTRAGRLPHHKYSAARLRCNCLVAAASSVAPSGGVVGGGIVRAASGSCRIRGVDHRAEERLVSAVLLSGGIGGFVIS